MYKINNNLKLDDNIKRHNHALYTRYRGNYYPQFQRLTSTQHSYIYSAPNIWNKIPLEIQNSKSFAIFKKRSKHYYINSIDIA